MIIQCSHATALEDHANRSKQRSIRSYVLFFGVFGPPVMKLTNLILGRESILRFSANLEVKSKKYDFFNS